LGGESMSGAVDWLRVSHTLIADPKLLRMSNACKVSRTAILGACVHVWSLADMTTTDGFLSGVDRDTIDSEVGVPGFVAAMETIGWAEVRTDGIMLVGFLEKNGGWTSKGRRVDAARRAAESRSKSKSRDGSVTNPHALVTNAHESVTGAHTPSMSPLVSVSSDSGRGGAGEKPAPVFPPVVVNGVPLNPCWDYGLRREVWNAYPDKGRRKPVPAMEAIGNAAEWVATARPEVGPPLAWLLDRVKAYARSDEAKSRYCRGIVGWLSDRAYNENDSAWRREEGKPKRKSYSEMIAERETHEQQTATHE